MAPLASRTVKWLDGLDDFSTVTPSDVRPTLT